MIQSCTEKKVMWNCEGFRREINRGRAREKERDLSFPWGMVSFEDFIFVLLTSYDYLEILFNYASHIVTCNETAISVFVFFFCFVSKSNFNFAK